MPATQKTQDVLERVLTSLRERVTNCENLLEHFDNSSSASKIRVEGKMEAYANAILVVQATLRQEQVMGGLERLAERATSLALWGTEGR